MTVQAWLTIMRTGWLLDSVFYEIDIPTQTVLTRWSAYEHNDQLNMLDISNYPQAGDKKEAAPWVSATRYHRA